MAGITKEMIDRINVLARKKRTIGLTEKEAAEQKRLYAAYLTAFRANFKAQLERIEIVDAPGAAEEADDAAPRGDKADETASRADSAGGAAPPQGRGAASIASKVTDCAGGAAPHAEISGWPASRADSAGGAASCEESGDDAAPQ